MAVSEIDRSQFLDSYVGFPYLGVYVDNDDFTAGILQVYIYYYEAATPILP